MINSWVNDYVGIPYKLHRQDHSACDCYGLVHMVYNEIFNITLPTYFDDYDSNSSKDTIQKVCRREKKYWNKVPENQEREGDLAYFRICGFEMHVGIVVGDNKFLHTIDKKGYSAIGDYTSIKWRNRLLGFWRHEQ